MQRLYHRPGAGVIVWRQSEAVATAATVAPTSLHRKVYSRGRSVRILSTQQSVVAGGVTISATPANAVASGSQATVSTAGTTTIAATPADAIASGTVAALLRTIAANPAIAQAEGVQAGVITSGAVVITASPANAIASGVVATIVFTTEFANAPSGGGYPPRNERSKRPAMANTRR